MLSYRSEDELLSIEKSYHTSKKRKRLFFLLMIIILAVIAVLSVLTLRIRPLISEIARSNIADLVTRVVNSAIQDMTIAGALDYEDLVTLEKDSGGRITALLTNMSKVNALQSDITDAVLDSLLDDKYMDISIPLGNVIGGPLLSGRGPRIPIKVLSVSYVTSNFVNEFSDAGINQTWHKIIIEVSVRLRILLPGKTESMEVVTEVTAAETVIVGEVPKTYAEFGKQEE